MNFGPALGQNTPGSQPNQPPADYVPNDDKRGRYLPLVLGRRMIGVNIGWVGDRVSRTSSSGGGKGASASAVGGTTWSEGGWHQLCHAPVRRIYKIVQGDVVLYQYLLDSTVVADGAQFQAGVVANPAKIGDVFDVYFGHDGQPVNPYLLSKAALDSAYPGLCYLVWRRKFLGAATTWPLMKAEVHTFAADVLAACGLYDPFTPAGVTVDFAETTPAVTENHNVTVWLNGMQPIAAGTYTITYQTGAFRLNSTDGWRVYAPNLNTFSVQVVTSDGTAVTHVPYVTADNLSPPNQYGTQAEAEAANAGATLTFNWPGGPMGFKTADVIANPGMVPGDPNPTYTVTPSAGGASYTASIAVQGGAAGSGDSGWNPAAALYVLVSAPAPYGCGLGANVWDVAALTAVGATLQAERLVVNVLVDQGKDAGDAVGWLLADVGMALNQVGGLLTPYLIRQSATVADVPLALLDGPPQQQRQVGLLQIDRVQFQYDDVLLNYSTGDVTADNDAQAASNNRPQSQTVRLETVTSRSVASAVAVRKAIELTAEQHKLPDLTVGFDGRSPQFCPGRTFTIGGVLPQYRVVAQQASEDGTTAKVTAVLDQYGEVDWTLGDDDDSGYSVPPAVPPLPDVVFDPIVLPRALWASPATPVFGVPRVRGSPGVTGADVWLATAQTGPYEATGTQDVAQAGGTLLAAFDGNRGVLDAGPAFSPYNDDVEYVPDLTGDDAGYAAGDLVLVVEQEVMLLRSVSPNADGSYTTNEVTRGAFGTTVVAHAAGTPAYVVSRTDLTPIASPLLAANQGGTLWVKTQPHDDKGSVVDLSLVTPEPLLVPLNLLATITVTAPTGGTVYVGQAVTVTWMTANLTGTLDLSYSTDGGTTWTPIAAGVADSGNYPWSTAGVPAATAVLVRVTSTTTPAVYGTSYPFALVTPVAPGSPTGLTATAGNGSATLNWTAPTGTPAAQLYRVKRGTASGGPYVTVATVYVPAGETLPTTYVDAGLTNGTPYYWVVTAVANGAESGNSNEATATPAVGAGTTGSTGNTSTGTTAVSGTETFGESMVPTDITYTTSQGDFGITGPSGTPPGCLMTGGNADFWIFNTPQWRVINGQLFTAEIDLFISDGPRIIYNFGFWLSGSADGSASGWAFRLQTSGTDGGFFKVNRADSGLEGSVIGTSMAAITAGRWYHVKLANSGTGGQTVSVTVTDTAAGSTFFTGTEDFSTLTDPTHPTSGTFGQVADGAGGAAIYVKNFQLTVP